MKNDLFNDRISRFSIRKLHVGVCSVLLGTLVMLGTAANVSADEAVEDKKVDGVAATTEVDKAEAPVTTEAAPAKEVTYKAEAAPAVSTEVKPELNREKLAAYVAEIEANVANGKYSNKTNESIEVLKLNLENAKNILETATSQAELDVAYQSLVTTVNTKLKNKEKTAVEEKVVVEEKIETVEKSQATTGKTAENTTPAEGTNSIANTGKNDPRNGKEIDKNTAFRADTATATGIGADVEDATSTPKAEKPGYSTLSAKEFTKQINWLDFGDTANWTNTTTGDNGQTALQVGSTYTKEIMPGYVVTVKVKSLKPFQATEIYKKRMEERGATAEEKATYDPNAKNGVVSGVMTPATKEAFKNGEEAKIIADPQNRWTEIRQEGINTGTKQTTIGSELNGSNIGVQFEISATFRGKSVKPAVVMADGESANPGELVLFTTNGTGWQHVGEWKKGPNGQPYVVQDTNYLFDPANGFINNKPVKVNGAKLNGLNLQLLIKSDQVGPDKKPVAWKYFGSADLTTGGLGTGVFGPNYSSGNVSVPLVMTRGASEIGLYIASSGKQAAMLGFFPLDEGDAPESYGKASHAIGTVDGVTGGKVSQPYLGDVSPDMDENNKGDWEGDDKSVTADEGIDQLLPDDLKGATNEMIKLDRTRPGNYTLKVEAHTDGADKAYLYGWIDFNQNGKFDDNERSDLATITQDGTVELKFNNGKAITDPSVTELGVRVRIAKDAKEIESPTGLALSGEVEDFKTQVTFPPKGERKETSDVQGAKQSSTIAFTPQGLAKYSRTQKAVIDEKVAPVMVDNKTKQVVTPGADGYYAVAGQGKYKITANGKDVDVEFIPEDNFVGTADGISIRRTDSNGNDTDWNSKDKTALPSINEVLDNMDGLYIPTVTPKDLEGINKTSSDVQGATQTGTPEFELEGTNSNGEKVKVTPEFDYPAKFVSPTTGMVINDPVLTVEGEGIYYLDELTGKVTFVPEPGFTGTAKGVTLSLTAPVGRDKNGDAPAEAIKTATAKYIPTVTPVTITPTNKESVDIQNVPQTQTPTFDLSSDKTAKITSKKLVDPATGQPTDETTVTVAGEGTYTIDPTTGAVTFTPEKDFVGTAKGVTVQATATITNANGKTATITSDATYTPTVLSAAPTAQPATSKDIQGAVQTGTPTFAGATVNVNGQDKQIPLKENSYKLLDNDGNEVSNTTAYAEDGTTPIGTFTIDSATGTVTFTPTDKSYTGRVTPVKVQAESTNGLKVDTTYTPEIVPVTPTATPAETTNVQGATQTGKPEFKGGTADVDGVEKAVAINEAVPAKFDDGTTSKKVEGVGTYTVAPDGTVTFVPEKSFVGKAPAVTVVREDMNGTKASATYTPTVTPVTPTATPDESVAPQGVVQTGTVTFTEGDPVAPIDKDTITLLDENGQPAASVDAKSPDGKVIGTFTVDKATGVVTFTPTDKTYSGDVVAVKVQAKDANGTPAETTYTPKITPVVPTAEDVTSKDKQGQTQTGKPKFTEGNPNIPMDDDTPATFEDGSTTKTIPGEGTYTVAPDGSVTFVPEKSFTGTGTGVTVKRVDKNGTPVTAKYTPTVTPVTPTATPAESVAPQGVVQTGTVTFTEGDPVAPIDKDTITLLDENGQPAASVVAKSPEGKEIGTFTVDKATGVVTFTPTDKTYSGDVVAVKVQAKDANGTPAETTYTPKITPVVPTAEDVTSKDKQGQTQTGKPKFTEGNPNIPMDDDTPATFEDGSTTKTIPGEGTYTVAPDGSVTFVPEKSFTGTGTGVTVKRVDKNGTPVTAKYTPTVTPVTPTATPAESVAPQGVVQTGTVTFTEGDPVAPIDKDTITLLDENGQPAASVVAKSPEGKEIGTFTVDKATGVVTFTPTDKTYSGDVVAVKVQAKDANGTPAETTYTPKIIPVVPTAEDVTSTDKQGQTQTGKPKFTEGNPNIPMDDDTPATFEDGSTTKTIPGEGT
ncbi:CshA/CshB family fibrillar adhesin-related protein, partial [Streptococcus infantis]|uniref:CshA/CshB family fibrillar adhesin-related protein n=1 Tax=Streptococcus infantis TaxID=68892 RepID=UPI0005F22869